MTDLALTAESPPRSPLAQEVARRRTFCDHLASGRRQDHVTEKLLLFGGAINLRARSRPRRAAQHPFRLDEDRTRARHLRRHLGDDVRIRRPCVQLLDTRAMEDFSEDTYAP